MWGLRLVKVGDGRRAHEGWRRLDSEGGLWPGHGRTCGGLQLRLPGCGEPCEAPGGTGSRESCVVGNALQEGQPGRRMRDDDLMGQLETAPVTGPEHGRRWGQGRARYGWVRGPPRLPEWWEAASWDGGDMTDDMGVGRNSRGRGGEWKRPQWAKSGGAISREALFPGSGIGDRRGH